jgi:hypothetical protein
LQEHRGLKEYSGAKKGRSIMKDDELVKAYLTALDAGDLKGMLALFAPDAVAHSPLYGSVPVPEFFKEMFAKSGNSKGTLLGTLGRGKTASGRPLLAFWFHFDWILASGVHAPFDAVDLCELNDEGLVVNLNIVYDTATVRPLLEKERVTMFSDGQKE